MISVGKKYLISSFTALIIILSGSALHAQGLSEGVYAGDVLQYSLQYPSYDPVSIVMPGVSDATGFGAYQENPASMAFFDEGFFSFGLTGRYVNQEGTYLGNTTSFDDSQTNIGDVGFVYNVPTARGRLAIGGGYSQTHDFNRALSVSGRNNETTITDSYPIVRDDSLFFAAFDAFAIDFATDDSTFAETASIFRIDAPYRGINQTAEITEEGRMGEYTAFIATELLRNLTVGASVGIISGSYSYRNEFLERDTQNDYETQFQDESGNLIGIDNIRSVSTIDTNFNGFSLRLGAIYQVSPNINLGVGYQLRNTLNIEEEFNTVITNTLDDGFQFQDDAPGRFEYKIVRPSRLNLGATIRELGGFTLSAAAERVAYSEGRVEFEEVDLADFEQSENEIVRSNLEDVFNLRFGLEYEFNEQFTPRVGYGYYPSPNANFDADRQFYSAGFSARLSQNTSLNLGAQLATWEDRNTLYTTPTTSEVVIEDVNHWNVMAGVTIDF